MMADANRPQDPAERKAQVLQHPAAGGDKPTERYVPTYLDLEVLEERGEPPPREWALDYWLGLGHVTLLAAKGGMGKSIFVQQLATALALKRDFVSTVQVPRRVLLWMGEDDDDELWRRQKAISEKFGVSLSRVRDQVMLESMVDTDCCLVKNLSNMGVVTTPMLEELRNQVGDTKADVVVLDNAAKLFQINENDRAQVTAAVTALNYAAAPTRAAVLLLGHAAKLKDSEYAGSTAWENSVRARWWLTDSPPDKQGGDDEEGEAPSDLRYLAKRKVNYSSTDLAILRYEAGAYSVVTPPRGADGIVASIDRAHAKRVVLAGLIKLKAMGLDPVEGSGSPHFLPKLIVAHALAEGFQRFDLVKAMRALLTDGEIVNKQVGTYPNRTPRMGLVVAQE